MKKLPLFFLIIFFACKSSPSGTKYLLDKNEIIITDSDGLNIDSVINGIDPIFGEQGLKIVLDKSYSDYFEKDNHPSIWVLSKELDMELIEKKISEKYEILLQAKTADETNDKSLTYNFMVKSDSIPNSLIFNTKSIKNKTYTVYFKSISGESSKMRNGYFDLVNGLK
ncbi:hypothetical protein [uncultured Zobellia sp.]|uniref:hypothetical protein n=1 Tax=uncultured Zobellia sp. TaxID=255433 RepID=UPI00259A953A|nr:hypothetical protein [uncultured Zobellia sp.]